MPRFEPFAAVRYSSERIGLDEVVAPPYDVITPDELQRLRSRSPYNVAHVDLVGDEADGDGPYAAAGRRFRSWIDEGVLARDPEPALYLHAMGYRDEEGRPRQTIGFVGALELSRPEEGRVLPHERTMDKPKDDRLQIMRASRANLSAIWVLSLADGLSSLCQPPGPPLARCTDDAGVHHRLWAVTRPAVVQAVADVVASAPAMIADGHHRYETALAYRDERRAATGDRPGDHDLVMAYVVELAEDQLTVRPIHRLVSGLPPGFDLVGALAPLFDPVEIDDGAASVERLATAATPALVAPDGAWLLRPRHDTGGTDAERVDVALAALPPHEVAYQHGRDNAVSAVRAGQAQAAILLRPPTVAQIADTARSGRVMPEKTTFFTPKPCTGLVFRELGD